MLKAFQFTLLVTISIFSLSLSAGETCEKKRCQTGFLYDSKYQQCLKKVSQPLSQCISPKYYSINNACYVAQPTDCKSFGANWYNKGASCVKSPCVATARLILPRVVKGKKLSMLCKAGYHWNAKYKKCLKKVSQPLAQCKAPKYLSINHACYVAQ